MKKNFNHIGKNIIRQDGLEKITGQAKFADDYSFPNQLHAVMVRIPAAHAKINSIDYSAIKNDPAIIAIVDSNDISGSKKIGAIRQDQPVFAFDKVRTRGDVVAMLVGESHDDLLKLKSKVKIDYSELPILSNRNKALEKDAPLIHEQYENNEIVHYPLRKGDIEKGFKNSDHILEQTYTTPLIEHAYLEPEAVTAIPREGNKGVQIIGSIQNPHTTQNVVAAVLGWPLAKVRIQQADLGGSFGGKDDIMNVLSARAAIAAIKTGRPVKIRYNREDSILESYKRHPYTMHYKVGFNIDGKLQSMKIDIIADGGAYSSMSPFVTWRTVVQATGPYEVENVWTDVRAVYTNNPYTGAFRGFGSPQPIFAQESLMDEIAIKLKMTPDKIRQINGFKAGSITASNQVLENHDVNLLSVMDAAIARCDFQEKWIKNLPEQPKIFNGDEIDQESLVLKSNEFIDPKDAVKKGIGLAVSFRGSSLGAEGIDAAAAYLSVQKDGSAYLLCGLAENGQGLRTTFSIIAAEVLGIDVDDIFYLEQDTGLIADSGPTVASRSTIMGGGAVKNAADKIKNRLIKVLLEEWNLENADNIIFKNNKAFNPEIKSQEMSFGDLCRLANSKGISLSEIGWNKGPDVGWEEETGQGDAYFTYVYGCQIAEVSVNTVTGEVSIDRVVAAHDPGTVINKLGAEGQIYGGVTQGAGYGLWEEISTHEGMPRELNLDEYLIPTSQDIGEIIPVFVEGKEKFGPWGAKSLGEPTLELTAAAISNAVRNAVGKRFFNLPLNLEELILERKLHKEDLQRGSL
ncbi:MAG: xanthine dehydrogenase [Calditrichaeota bacterium]|nr:MAG: xanthine dehydrogenase [Calditrichota bacterium]MBL1204730.1 xanthine dehydrogenase [Calditrichota bacterium]NOG44558.1 xanthine dehydrogenase family protein [Calditrichota bacterium]